MSDLGSLLRLCWLPFLIAYVTAESSSLHVDTYYVVHLLDAFQQYSSKHLQNSDKKHAQHQLFLQDAIEKATAPSDKRILEVTAAVNEESRLEAQNAYSEMINFATTLKQALGSKGGAASCDDLSCGHHASCSMSLTSGASCVCDEGWVGDGFVCKPPIASTANPLLLVQGAAEKTWSSKQVADVSVALLSGDRVGMVYRDISEGERGFLVLGEVAPQTVKWSRPMLFSGGRKTFGPAVAYLPGGCLAIAYRDLSRDGAGILQCVKVSPEGALAIGEQRAFARRQARQMALAPLPDGHLAVIFADHVSGVSQGRSLTSSRGAALLSRVHSDALGFDVLGKYRFVDAPVARFSVAPLSPASFVVAYRENAPPDAKRKAEASVVLAQFRGGRLAFDPHPLLLEPDRSQIWARSVSPVSENTFAYAYHSGDEQVTKQAIIRVGSSGSRRMEVVDGPVEVDRGFTPFVGSVGSRASLLGLWTNASEAMPRTFTYYSKGGNGFARAQVCSVNDSGRMEDCQGLDFANHELASVSGTPLQDGRVLLAFTDVRGSPYYQLVGLDA